MSSPRDASRRVAQPGLLATALLAWVVASLPLAAQAPPPPAEAQGEEGAGKAPDFQTIDELLAQDEEILSDPGTYAYDPGARRDPFRSLLQNRNAELPPGERPEGVPGLMIDEIEIQGVFITQSGPVAQVQAASQETSYLIRPGDQLWDGDVVSITLEEVVFKQAVNDPTALRPFREVVKQLNPSG